MIALRSALLLILLISSIVISSIIYSNEQVNFNVKSDLVELSKVQYGIFNVDEWNVKLTSIIIKKIEDFNLEDDNRKVLKAKIQNFLNIQINKLEHDYFQEKKGSFIGIVQSGVASITGAFRQIKKNIPEITDDILDFLEDNKNKEALRGYVLDKVKTYSANTFSETDYTKVNQIIDKYDHVDFAKTKSYLEESCNKMKKQGQDYKIALVVLALFAVFVLLVSKKSSLLELIIFLAISVVFLVLGVFLPMIEIDVRISEMSFKLLGEDIHFFNQVLYYKSKSILEVVSLMIKQGRIDLVAVGILVLTFSVLFPTIKLICSLVFLLNSKIRQNPFVKFMVFKSGKWSMADVMVIAIFMAYIGFDGVISEQLNQLKRITQNIEFLTTNQSSLLFGFYSFTCFVLLSLVISHKIQKTA